MFYVVRQGESLENYHSTHVDFESAKEQASQLKSVFRRQYEIIKVETVWSTKTLAERSKQAAL